jgi:acetyl esterase/lipase
MKSISRVSAASVFLSLALSAAAQLPSTPANGPGGKKTPLPAGVRELKDIAYVPDGHERQKLDLYLPENLKGPLPVIIWVHGGAWLLGSKDECPAVFFATRGYAVASVGYRLSMHAVFPAQIEDCKAAVRWLRANAVEYGLDTNRFGAWGASAGGHLVALLDMTGGLKDFDVGGNLDQSSRVQAVVDYFGPTDFLHWAEQAGTNSMINHDAPDSPEARLIGGRLKDNPDKANRVSPITYVSKDAAPMLIVQGDADPLVPHQQSEELYDDLKKAGADVQLHIVKGGGHGTGFPSDVGKLVVKFFDEHLKGGPAQ